MQTTFFYIKKSYSLKSNCEEQRAFRFRQVHNHFHGIYLFTVLISIKQKLVEKEWPDVFHDNSLLANKMRILLVGPH